MAVKALNVGSVNRYVTKTDIPDKQKPGQSDEDYQENVISTFVATVWPLKTLDSRTLGILRDRATRVISEQNNEGKVEMGTRISTRAFYYEVCSLALGKPENFLDKDGKEVPFTTVEREVGGVKYDAVTYAFLGKIDGDTIAELADVIMEGNIVTAEEGNVSA